MQLKCMKTYELQELDITVQEKVMDEIRMSGVLHEGLEENLSEALRDELKKVGVEWHNDDQLHLRYELSYEYGRSYVNFDLNRVTWKDHTLWIKNQRSGTEIRVEDDYGDYVIELQNKLKQIYNNICRTLRREGYNILKYEDSKEYIIEDSQLNERRYYSNGDPVLKCHEGEW